MILEELYSKLGFQVEGLNKLRAARKEFEKTRKSALATNKTMVATGRGTGIAAAGSARLGTALRTILGVFARLVVVAAGAAIGIAAVGTAFVVAGIRAARARREFVLTAKEMGTTGQNLETLGNILRVAGFGDGFEEEAKKVAGAVDEISKAVRKGGDDAVEAKKKIAGFGIDKSFDVDPKTGKSRDSVAIALDLFQAYKRATEQAAGLRKEADAVAGKAPKKAAALRKKALAQDQKTEQFAADAGINGRLRVLLDNTPLKDFPELFRKASSWLPTTSNKSEARQDDVAKQAEEASLKLAAIWGGLADRFKDFGQILAKEVLPPLNKFLDGLVAFGKATGIISETTGERADRLEREREHNRAANFGRLKEETPQQRRNRAQAELLQQQIEDDRKRYGTPTTAPLPPERPEDLPVREKAISPAKQPQRTPTTAIRDTQADLPSKLEALRNSLDANAKSNGTGWLDYFRKMLSPEVNAAKLQKTAEQTTDQRKYENIGNDQRTISPTINVQASGLDEVAAKVKASVLGAISTKGANTSTGALTAP